MGALITLLCLVIGYYVFKPVPPREPRKPKPSVVRKIAEGCCSGVMALAVVLAGFSGFILPFLVLFLLYNYFVV